MNLIHYIFFVVYFFSTLNHVKSRLSHVKVTHRNGAKIYTVGGKQFKTLRNAHKHNKRRSKLLRKKPIRRPTRRLTRKNTRRRTNRIINRRPTSRSNRFPPLISRHQPTPPPIIATTTKVDEIAEKIKAYYKEINEHRGKHSADPLKVNQELVKRAEESAKTFAREKKRPESVFDNYVRNCVVFREFSDNPVAYWYRQKDNHKFDNPEHKESSEGFIHMLWKAATDVGCGMVYNNEEYFVCCEFSPVEKVKEKDEIIKNVSKE